MKLFIRRFEEKFLKKGDDECWEWLASKNQFGYGQIRAFGIVHKAHRISYELYVDEIVNGMDVLHRCDNPGCINPNHLFLGTAQDNVDDMIRKGRNVKLFGNRKLTERQVLEIFYEDGMYKDICKKYGVGEAEIMRIKNKKIWKHVTKDLPSQKRKNYRNK